MTNTFLLALPRQLNQSTNVVFLFTNVYLVYFVHLVYVVCMVHIKETQVFWLVQFVCSFICLVRRFLKRHLFVCANLVACLPVWFASFFKKAQKRNTTSKYGLLIGLVHLTMFYWEFLSHS